MPRTIVLEELHLTATAPVTLRRAEYQAMLRTLRSRSFRVRLLNALRAVLRRYPSLRKSRFRIER